MSTPPRDSIHRCCCRDDSALSRKVMIHVRGTSAGKSLRSTRSVITRADSGYRRDSACLRCSCDIALQNANRAAVFGDCRQFVDLGPYSRQRGQWPAESVHHRQSLRRNERRRQHHLAHPGGAEPGDDTGHGQPSQRMPNDDNITHQGVLHVINHRVHPIGDGNCCQICGVAASTRQVDREHAQFWFPTG